MLSALGCMLIVVLLGTLANRFLKIGQTTNGSKFDSDYCFKIAKLAASICVGLVIVETLILALVDPSGSLCPGWTFTLRSGATVSPGPLTIFICIPAAIGLCVQVFRWQHLTQRMYDSIESSSDPLKRSGGAFYGRFNGDPNRLVLVVLIGWCLFCSIPLWMMFFGCTNLLG